MLRDGKEVIVSFACKENEIDMTKVALLLGGIVPDVHTVKVEVSHFAYISNFIPGTMWSYTKEIGLTFTGWQVYNQVSARPGF